MVDVVEIGGMVVDLVGYTEVLPKPGEMVLGDKFCKFFGGKGANQCVTANRLGATVAIIGKVGKDQFGDDYLGNLKNLGLDTKFVFRSENCSTAIGLISVSSSGQNSIVGIPGANMDLQVEEVLAARDLIASARVLLCQLEVPQHVSLAALEIARTHGVITVLNPAPFPSAKNPLRRELLLHSDFICPNELEAQAITGLALPLDDLHDPEPGPSSAGDGAASALSGECVRRARPLLEWIAREAHQMGNDRLVVIITLGRLGLVFRAPDGSVEFVAAQRVRAVDATGAGDSFCGTLGFLLSRFDVAELRAIRTAAASGAGDEKKVLTLRELLRRAGLVATRSVMKAGTQTSFPFRHELPDEWFS